MRRRSFTFDESLEREGEMNCFFCSNQINPQRQRHVFATVEHRYKSGGVRHSDRGFHLSCFDKFLSLSGRPFNPQTTYAVLQARVKRGGEILCELGYDGEKRR